MTDRLMVNQAERDEHDAEVAPYIGKTFDIDEADCCLSVRFRATLLGVDWEATTYTAGPRKGEWFWLDNGYRFDNGVVLDGWRAWSALSGE